MYETDKLEMFTRRENIRISSLGEDANEVLEDKIFELASDIEVNISVNDISVAHRLGKNTNNGKPHQIIVRFVSRSNTVKMLLNKKKMKQMSKYKNIYINEDLSPARSKMLYYTKSLDNVKQAYTKNGKIFCKGHNDQILC